MKCQNLFSGKNKKTTTKETICMKCLNLFSGKNKKKILPICHLNLHREWDNFNIVHVHV